MTYRAYKNILTIFLVLLAPIIFLNIIEIRLLKQYPVMEFLISYCFPILSLILLYFGIYSYIQKIKPFRKLESPITVIILASFLTIASFTYPLLNYYLSTKVKDDSEIEAVYQQFANNLNINTEVEYNHRLSVAKHYYIITGMKIEYLDNNLNKVLFSPTEDDKKKRLQYEQNLIEFERVYNFHKTKVFRLLIYAILSCILFLLFIKVKLISQTKN